ncbi:MAG TPA: helix-turn-helix domain-containing protein [Anaerolineales bacterium]|jgi:excisionase family DNA binding protein|nr:helix-turn-helix domain-containing protein [Anaerolineales bacterium]
MSDWLNLSKAAKILGVHPSTVRLWADQGRIPVHRTQGGHRRFKRQEVEFWTQAQQLETPREADLLVQSALGRTRFQISEGRLEKEGWYLKLDKDARNQYRRGGREMLRGLNTFLVTDESTGKAEARSLGVEYASIGRRCGLNSSEAVQAFLFFRNMLMESMITVYESSAINSPYAWGDMLRKLNDFTDQVLLVLLERYQIYQDNGR